MSRIRIGTRGSRLALKQAALVQEALRKADSRIETEIVILHTKGDKIQDKPLSEIGDKGVFASEFEQALLKKEIDMAVHSAKDLPAVLAAGLTIAAVLPRADVRDVLVVPKGGRRPSLAVEYGTEGREAPDIE
ncbi:MAG: hydroxymethylbilane synthase, partial [Lachnospiraceae bacterium]|nr:hydroxymethylbilane synthase [Lachnospiraceae bacterium]